MSYKIIETFYEPGYGQHYKVVDDEGNDYCGDECSLDDCEQLIDELTP